MLSLALALLAPQTPAVDVAFHPYRRSVGAPAGERRLVALTLPRDLLARARGDLADLTLLDSEGRLVPYRIEESRLLERRELRAGRLVSVADAPRSENHWTADFGDDARYDAIDLQIEEPEFARDVVVQGSEDLETWSGLWTGSLFRRPWRGGVAERTSVDLDAPASFRYVTVSSVASRAEPPLRVRGLAARQRWSPVGRDSRWPVAARRVDDGTGAQRFMLDVTPGTIIDRLEAETGEPLFRAGVRVLEFPARRDGTGATEGIPVATGTIYRMTLGPRLEQRLAVSVRRRVEREWTLELETGDSPSPPDIRWFAVGPARRLLFVASPGSYVLYYGREDATPRRFDIAELPMRPDESVDLPDAELGPEDSNPAFDGPPAFAAETGAGAALEPRLWRVARALPGGAPGPAEVMLEPADIAALRPDLGDLRIVSAAGDQIPYLIDPAPVPRRITAGFEEGPSPGRGSQTVWIRPRIEGAIPVEGIAIVFREPSFARSFTLFALDERGRETFGASGRLSPRPNLRPIELGVATSGRVQALRLAIDNGDNAALTPTSAEILTWARRVVYNATDQNATLLLGNPRAAAPRYDVAAIAPELLSAGARRVVAGETIAGSSFAPTVEAAAARGVDRTALWGILGLSVVALLLLTVRLLRDQSR